MADIRQFFRWESDEGSFEFELADTAGRLLTGDGQLIELSKANWITLRSVLAKAMPAEGAPRTRNAALTNAGKPWPAEHDAELARMWKAKMEMGVIAKHFGRTRGAIAARLERQGLTP